MVAIVKASLEAMQFAQRDNLADSFDTDNSGGWLTKFLADEDDLDRRSLWRLGSWGVGSVAAVVVAVMAGQSSIGRRARANRA